MPSGNLNILSYSNELNTRIVARVGDNLNPQNTMQNVILHNILHSRAWQPGGRLNKKDGLTRYGDSHVKDKTS